jgi:hypothetical protein
MSRKKLPCCDRRRAGQRKQSFAGSELAVRWPETNLIPPISPQRRTSRRSRNCREWDGPEARFPTTSGRFPRFFLGPVPCPAAIIGIRERSECNRTAQISRPRTRIASIHSGTFSVDVSRYRTAGPPDTVGPGGSNDRDSHSGESSLDGDRYPHQGRDDGHDYGIRQNRGRPPFGSAAISSCGVAGRLQ